MALALAAPAQSTAPALARSAHFEVYAQGGEAAARAILLSFERLHAYFSRQSGLRLAFSQPLFKDRRMDQARQQTATRRAAAHAEMPVSEREIEVRMRGGDAARERR